MSTGLSESDWRKIKEVLHQFPAVKKAVLYGSRAKGNYRPASNIELTLFGTDLGIPGLSAIASALDNLLLPYKIDLNIHHTIDNPELLEHIERVGIIVVEK